VTATPARPTPSPLGNWSTSNGRGIVACGDALCGRIVGIDRKPTDRMPTDVRGRSQCGLTIITNQRPKGDGTWLGEVTDPRDGDIYQAKLWINDDGNLRLRGCWKAVDVLAGGSISRVAVQRSDFRSVLASGGVPALTSSLQHKAANLQAA